MWDKLTLYTVCLYLHGGLVESTIVTECCELSPPVTCRIRDLNDEINKLIREKGHWEVRIVELGGPDYAKVAFLLFIGACGVQAAISHFTVLHAKLAKLE